MHKPILLLLLLFFSLSISTDPITLTFFVEHQCQIDKDYLQMVVNIKAEDTSLKQSLEDAAESVLFVRGEVLGYCLLYAKNKAQCQEISQSGKFKVEPVYRTIRGEPVFIQFAVSYEVTAKILYYNAEKVGPLVDRIGKRSGSTITSMKWKDADEEDQEMIAIDKGLEEAEKRCQNVDAVLSEFVSVNQVPRFQLEEKEDQDEEEQEPEEGPEIIKYKFVVKCLPKGTVISAESQEEQPVKEEKKEKSKKDKTKAKTSAKAEKEAKKGKTQKKEKAPKPKKEKATQKKEQPVVVEPVTDRKQVKKDIQAKGAEKSESKSFKQVAQDAQAVRQRKQKAQQAKEVKKE